MVACKNNVARHAHDWCWGIKFSKVIRRYDKEEEDEVIAEAQLLDRTWRELKICPEEPRHQEEKTWLAQS